MKRIAAVGVSPTATDGIRPFGNACGPELVWSPNFNFEKFREAKAFFRICVSSGKIRGEKLKLTGSAAGMGWTPGRTGDGLDRFGGPEDEQQPEGNAKGNRISPPGTLIR